MIDLLQWIGSATGVIGSLLLALRITWSGWGFVFYVVSNICWIAFGIATNTNGLVVMQCVFMVTSIAGIWGWLLLPYIEDRRKARRAKESAL